MTGARALYRTTHVDMSTCRDKTCTRGLRKSMRCCTGTFMDVVGLCARCHIKAYMI
jgi:hypothetical protein